MKFVPETEEEPEINLIPLIDVLLMALIFLLVTTSFSAESHLSIRLPEASSTSAKTNGPSLQVTIDANGHYYIANKPLPDDTVLSLRATMARAAGDKKNPLIIIDADGRTPHEAVVRVMDVAQQLGFTHLTFTTRQPKGNGQ